MAPIDGVAGERRGNDKSGTRTPGEGEECPGGNAKATFRPGSSPASLASPPSGRPGSRGSRPVPGPRAGRGGIWRRHIKTARPRGGPRRPGSHRITPAASPTPLRVTHPVVLGVPSSGCRRWAVPCLGAPVAHKPLSLSLPRPRQMAPPGGTEGKTEKRLKKGWFDTFL